MLRERAAVLCLYVHCLSCCMESIYCYIDMISLDLSVKALEAWGNEWETESRDSVRNCSS